MRISHLALALTTTLAFACGGSGNANNDSNNDSNNSAAVCPFTFPELTGTFGPGASPALLTFAALPDATPNVLGDDGSGIQYLVEYPSLNGSTINYTQNLQGTSILFKPDEISSERDRLENNAKTIFGATTSNTTVTLGGQEVDVLVAKANTETLMYVFLPIDGGDFIVPITIGIFAGANRGCEATIEAAYQSIKASLALNTTTTYNELEAIVEAKEAKTP